MPTPVEMIRMLLLPVVISTALALLAWFAWPRRSARGIAAAALAIAGGFVLPAIITGTHPPFPPLEATGRLYYIAWVLLVFALIDAAVRTPRWIWMPAMGLLSLTAVRYMLRPLVPHAMEPEAMLVWTVGIGAILAAQTTGCDLAPMRSPGSFVPGMFLLIAATGAITISLSGSLSVGMLGMIVAATLGPLLILSFFAKAFAPSRGLSIFLFLFCGLLILGRFYTELTMMNATLLFIAPLLIHIEKLPWVRSRKQWQRRTLVAVLILAPITAAVASAGWEFQKSQRESTDLYY